MTPGLKCQLIPDRIAGYLVLVLISTHFVVRERVGNTKELGNES
jgi:hypothetical protein